MHLLFGLVDERQLEDAEYDTLSPRRRDTTHGVPTGRGADSERWKRFGTNPAGSVSAIIGAYKAAVTRSIHQRDPSLRVWQPRFHDRIVRSPKEADALRVYIRDNPTRWRLSSCLSP